MPTRRSHPRPTLRLESLATLGLVALWVAGGMGATVASASPGRGHAEGGGHRCKCGVDCGDSCCCAPKGAKAPASKAPDRKTPSVVTPGPCVGPSPCGGALPPGAGPTSMVGDPADRSAVDGPRPAERRSLLAPPDSERPGILPGSRTDEPPESIDA